MSAEGHFPFIANALLRLTEIRVKCFQHKCNVFYPMLAELGGHSMSHGKGALRV